VVPCKRNPDALPRLLWHIDDCLCSRFSTGARLSIIERNNVVVRGRGQRPMMFAHGFGCDQNMWRLVAPAFEDKFKVILFDHVGAGGSDIRAYSREKYDLLDGYADDVIEICDALALKDVVFVGHSVSSMIGVIAAAKVPDLFDALVLVGPSPRYIDDGEYIGGFSAPQIEELLEFLDSNHMGWSTAMAPTIMGNPDRPELGEELANSFCRTDPAIAKHFARTTFMSDNRADLPKVQTRTLILQCSQDAIAPTCVGEYVHKHLPNSKLFVMQATGHCPNLSAPAETIAAIQSFV
jgi:sigma-B regulation protein RsbQ